MKKKITQKLVLHRESLRLLDDGETRTVAAAAPVTGLCAYTLQVVNCYSRQVPSCVCTGQ